MKRQIFPNMRMNDWVTVVHENARNKGFYDVELDPAVAESAVKLLLIISEVCEAFESVRKGRPEEEPSEIADTIIRTFDYVAHKGWDIEQAVYDKHIYNLSRPYLHGKKF